MAKPPKKPLQLTAPKVGEFIELTATERALFEYLQRDQIALTQKFQATCAAAMQRAGVPNGTLMRAVRDQGGVVSGFRKATPEEAATMPPPPPPPPTQE